MSHDFFKQHPILYIHDICAKFTYIFGYDIAIFPMPLYKFTIRSFLSHYTYFVIVLFSSVYYVNLSKIKNFTNIKITVLSSQFMPESLQSRQMLEKAI